MISRIAVRKHEFAIIKSILKETDYKVTFFGSRIHDNWRENSDLNICLEDISPVPDRIIHSIEQRFAESKLPYPVRITDFYSSSQQLKMIIEHTSVSIDDITESMFRK